MNQMIKRLLCMLAVLMVLAVFGVFALGSGSSDADEDQGGDAATSEKGKSNLGDYNVEIKACRLAEDYEGKPIAIITYVFTNNDDEAAAFYIALDAEAYQDGIGLNECYIVADDVDYLSDNATKEIKTGSSLEVEVAYELNDTTTAIEVEVSETFSFSDKKVTKTFSIK